MVVPEHEAGGHVLADGAEVPAHTLADRLQGLEAVGALVGVDADAFAVAVIDGDEDVGHALGQGDALGHIGAPQDVHGLGGDGAVVRLVRSLADPVRRQQASPAAGFSERADPVRNVRAAGASIVSPRESPGLLLQLVWMRTVTA